MRLISILNYKLTGFTWCEHYLIICVHPAILISYNIVFFIKLNCRAIFLNFLDKVVSFLLSIHISMQPMFSNDEALIICQKFDKHSAARVSGMALVKEADSKNAIRQSVLPRRHRVHMVSLENHFNVEIFCLFPNFKLYSSNLQSIF